MFMTLHDIISNAVRTHGLQGIECVSITLHKIISDGVRTHRPVHGCWHVLRDLLPCGAPLPAPLPATGPGLEPPDSGDAGQFGATHPSAGSAACPSACHDVCGRWLDRHAQVPHASRACTHLPLWIPWLSCCEYVRPFVAGCEKILHVICILVKNTK